MATSMHDEYKILKKQKVYRSTICGTTDIQQIADSLNISTYEVIAMTEEIIKSADKGAKAWYAFKGAYINHGEGRIVLAISPSELVVCIKFRVMGVFEWICFLAAIPTLGIIYLLEFEPQVVIGFAALWLLPIDILFRKHGKNSKNKRIKNYIRLISEQKMSSIESIARNVGRSEGFVREELWKLIDRNSFINARINPETDEIIVISREFDISEPFQTGDSELHIKKISDAEIVAEIVGNPNKMPEIYRIALSETTDIRKIARQMKLSYEETAGYLDHIIGRSRSKDWCGFRNAYMDYEHKRIVLAIPPDELVTVTTSMAVQLIWRFVGYLIFLAGFSWLFISRIKPEWSEGLSQDIKYGLIFIGLSIMWIVMSHIDIGYATPGGNRRKRMRRYVQLISGEKMTSLTDIANAMGKSIEFVKKDLQKNIDRYFIVNARITNNRIEVLSSQNK